MAHGLSKKKHTFMYTDLKLRPQVVGSMLAYIIHIPIGVLFRQSSDFVNGPRPSRVNICKTRYSAIRVVLHLEVSLVLREERRCV